MYHVGASSTNAAHGPEVAKGVKRSRSHPSLVWLLAPVWVITDLTEEVQ